MRLLAMLRTKPHESPVAAELDLMVAEVAGDVVLIEVEVAEVVELPLHTQMVRATRRTPRYPFLQLNLVHGITQMLR